MAPGAGFDFFIEQSASGWRWAAVSPSGEVIATGCAASRRQAAAFVISAMVIHAAPPDPTSAAFASIARPQVTPLRAA